MVSNIRPYLVCTSIDLNEISEAPTPAQQTSGDVIQAYTRKWASSPHVRSPISNNISASALLPYLSFSLSFLGGPFGNNERQTKIAFLNNARPPLTLPSFFKASFFTAASGGECVFVPSAISK